MKVRREALLERRLLLLQRSGALRDQLARHSAGLAPVFDAVDRTRFVGRWMRSHPWVPALGAVVLWWLKPRFVWRWATRAWTLWRLAQRVRQRVPSGVLQGVMSVFRR